MDSIAELRKKVQEPVRRYNDVAGLLIGDRVSIHVTRLFLSLGLSPTVASIGMLVFGLGGSVLVAFGGGWSLAGFGCLFTYYVLDCVDGEVARYRGAEKLVWGLHDFMFHLYVKSAFFIGIGIWSVKATGHAWFFAFGLGALLATLFQKFLNDLDLILTSRQVLLRSREERKRFLAELLRGDERETFEEDDDEAGGEEPYRPGPLGLLRVAATNFDLGIVAFLIAATVDMVLPSVTVWGVEASCVLVLYVLYGLALPFDFLDRMQNYLRSGSFHDGGRALVRRAHHFRVRDEDWR